MRARSGSGKVLLREARAGEFIYVGRLDLLAPPQGGSKRIKKYKGHSTPLGACLPRYGSPASIGLAYSQSRVGGGSAPPLASGGRDAPSQGSGGPLPAGRHASPHFRKERKIFLTSKEVLYFLVGAGSFLECLRSAGRRSPLSPLSPPPPCGEGATNFSFCQAFSITTRLLVFVLTL